MKIKKTHLRRIIKEKIAPGWKCTSGPYAGWDDAYAWEQYTKDFMNTEEPDDELPKRGRAGPVLHEPTEEDVRLDFGGDLEGYNVHLTAKNICGDDQECYIDYVVANDPKLKDVDTEKTKERVLPLFNDLDNLLKKFQK